MRKETPKDILRNVFGYDNFRFEQKEIIERVLSKKDTLVLMPTGGGKSLCYQIPALLLDGLTIVVSPLISLMKDQVDALRVSGIPAAYLNSSISTDEQSRIARQLQNNQIKLLYVAPERLVGSDNRFFTFLQELTVSLLAVDEAHCISQWGHDFRPEYGRLAEVRKLLKVPTIALTATADQLTRKDILERLQLQDPKVFISSFNRPNIHYQVLPKRNSYHKLLDFLSARRDESGIIYVLSRSSTEELANKLTQDGYQAVPYHARLDAITKEKHQELFLRDEIKIVVATIAFGMGINKSNVRYVVHMDVPKNMEGYYQETGRAGRDGLNSNALLFYSYADVMKLQGFVEVEGNKQQSEIMLRKLQEMATFGELRTCRRKYLLNYFGEEAPDECDHCDVCQTDYQKIDGTVIAQKALSAVVRLEERFGLSYVIDFLRGSQSEKIWDQHKQLKTYGAGADLSKKDWRRYLDDLLHLDFLRKDEGKFPVLKLTEKSWPVLRGEERVMLIESVNERENEVNQGEHLLEEVLVSQLKRLRIQLARQENVPAYVIFSDATLHELATYLPQTLEDLSRISGFGEVKIEKYGTQFLEVVQDYMHQNNLESRISNTRQRHRRTTRATQKTSNTKQASFDLFQEGNEVKEVAQLRGLTINTVYGHLLPYLADGQVEASQLVTPERISAIREAIRVHGESSLKTLKTALDEAITYEEIKVVLVEMRRER